METAIRAEPWMPAPAAVSPDWHRALGLRDGFVVESLSRLPASRLGWLEGILSGKIPAFHLVLRPDPSRAHLYELEISGTIYYFYLSPDHLRVVVLANWPSVRGCVEGES